MDNALRQALQHTDLGQTLKPDELEQLITYAQCIDFAPGEIILEQGKKSPGMYIILKGTALVTAKILGEGGIYINTLIVGNLAGEISLIEQGPCATSVLASNQVTCLLITTDYFEMLTIFNQETKYKITCVIAKEVMQRLNEMFSKISNFIISLPMTAGAMFSEVIYSLTYPSEMQIEGNIFTELRSTMLFRKFNKEEFNILCQYLKLLKTPKNYPLTQQVEKQAMMLIVWRGAVQTSIIEDKKVAKLSVLGPPSLFYNIKILNNISFYHINYVTCEKTLFLTMNAKAIFDLQNKHPHVWYKLFDLICKSFVALERAANKLNIRLNSELYNR